MAENIQVASLFATLGLSTKGWSKGLRGFLGSSSKLKGEMKSIGAQSSRLGDVLNGTAATISRLGPALAAIGVAVGTKQIMDASDAYTDLNSRVAAVVGGADKATPAMARLADIAARTYSSIEQTTQGYLANATVLKDLGLSADQALDYTEALNNAMVVSGAKGDQAASVQKALSDALILGKLSGDGLNSVMTQGGVVAELLAEALGTTVSGLKQMGTEGKITSDVIVKTLFKNFDGLRQRADEMPATFGDAAVQVGNAITILAGRFNEITGSSSEFTGSIKGMTDSLIEFAYSPAFEQGIVSFQNMLMTWASAQSATFAPMIEDMKTGIYDLINGVSPLNDIFVDLGNIFTGLSAIAVPVFQVIWEAIKTIVSIATDMASVVTHAFGSILGPIGQANDAVGEGGFIGTLRRVADQISDTGEIVRDRFEIMAAYGQGAVDAIAAAFSGLPPALGDLMIQAANSVIGAVEYMVNGVISLINGAIQAARSAAAQANSILATATFGQMGSHTGAAMTYGPQQPTVAEIDIQLENTNEGKAAELGTNVSDAFFGKANEALKKQNERNVNRLLRDLPDGSELNNDILGTSTTETGPSVTVPEIKPIGGGAGGGGKKGKGGGGGKGKGTKEKLSDYQKAVKDLNDDITKLEATMGMTAEQEAIWTAQHKAGVLGNEASMLAIENLVKKKQALEEQSDMIEKNKEATESMGDAFADVFSGILSGSKSASDALRDMISMIGSNVIKNFFAMLGGANSKGASILTWMFGSIGNNANGTAGWGGGLTWVGERGPELINLNRGAQVQSTSKSMRTLRAANDNSGKVPMFMVDTGVKQVWMDEANANSIKNTAQGINQYRRSGVNSDVRKFQRDPRAK